MLNAIALRSWNYDAASHLSLRAGFGEPTAELEKWVSQGLDSTLEHLLHTSPPGVAPPEWAYPTRDEDLLPRIRNPRTAAEERAQLQRQLNERKADQMASLVDWWTQRMCSSPAPLAEKMTLFWHGHRQLGQLPFYPPNVKGWDGGKSWINTTTLAYRYELARELVNGILPEQVGLPKAPPKPSPSPKIGQPAIFGLMRSVANSPSPKSTVTLIPPPAPTPPSQLTGGLSVGRILTADDRRDFRHAIQKLSQCIFLTNPKPEFRERFIQIANSKPHPLDDHVIRDLAMLMMSTPNYQVC